MRFANLFILLIPFVLASCASTATPQIEPEVSASQTRGIDIASPTPLRASSSTNPEADDSIHLDEIDPTLIADRDRFNIQFRTESTRDCRYTMQYPEVSGLANTRVQTRLNRSLRQNMIEQMQISGDLLEGNRCPDELQNPIETYTRTFRCTTHFAKSRLISLTCATWSLPGAYPYVQIHPVTFSLETGEIYRFSELFKSEANYSVRMAVLMRDAWWEVGPGAINFPFETLERKADFDYYFQDRCNVAFAEASWQNSPLNLGGSLPKFCMVLPNLGSGASRNYLMTVRMNGTKDILSTNGALAVLQELIDERWQPY